MAGGRVDWCGTGHTFAERKATMELGRTALRGSRLGALFVVYGDATGDCDIRAALFTACYSGGGVAVTRESVMRSDGLQARVRLAGFIT